MNGCDKPVKVFIYYLFSKNNKRKFKIKGNPSQKKKKLKEIVTDTSKIHKGAFYFYRIKSIKGISSIRLHTHAP